MPIFTNNNKNFTCRVEICNLNPDSLDPEECPEGCTKKWEMSVFEGEWVRGTYYVILFHILNLER